MAQVKVWNDNAYDYTEVYREKTIMIPAKSFIMMEEDEAHDFKCSFSTITRNADGVPEKKSYKMIRIGDSPTTGSTTKSALKDSVCHACNQDLITKKALEAHVKAEHSHLLAKDEKAEKAMAERKLTA